MKKFLLLVLALVLPLQAQQMNYQGRLTDAQGNARPGAQSTITFSLWTAAAAGAGTRVWGPFATNVDLIDGRFSTKLGDAMGGDNQEPERLLNQVFTDPLFLEMTVGTDAAALPRQEILPSPAAFYAEKANHSVTADTAANFTSLVLKTDEDNERVGIGTPSPARRLSVVQALGDPYGFEVTDGNVKVGTWIGNDVGEIGTINNFRFDLITNDVPRIIITPDGNVGVGTNNPVQKLQVAGTAVVTGNVGIGTTTPSAKLDVNGAPGELALRVQVNGLPKLVVDPNGGVSAGGFVTPPANGLYVAGNVGIGTSNPQVKLDVVGSTSITMIDNGYNGNAFSQNGINWTALGAIDPNGAGIELYSMAGGGGFAPKHTVNAPVGIRADGYIATAKGFVVYSDRRIKRDIQASPAAKDLAAIQQLQVTDYRMVDPADGGMAWRKGFIAQELEKVMPLAVTRSTEFVPDIFSVATAVAYDPAVKTLTLTLAKDHGLKSGDRVRLHIDGKREDLNVSAVPSALEFVVDQCENKPEKVLVYGKQVSDFRTVNYDRIFTTSVGAVQELARKVETQELECTELREANVALRNRVAALEAKDRTRDTKIASIEKLLNSRNPPVTRTISVKAE